VNDPERVKLRFGPYKPPALKRGDRAVCLVRGCEVVVTNWTAARIPWPRCRSVRRVGGWGLLVDEELARAISPTTRTGTTACRPAAWTCRCLLFLGVYGGCTLRERPSELSLQGSSQGG
jgi:hypothetical protein